MDTIADNLPAAISNIIADSPSSVALLDRQLCYISASKKWITDFKMGSELKGKCHTDIFSIEGKCWDTAFQAALNGTGCKNEKDKLVFPNGTDCLVAWELQPFILDNREVGGLLVYMDLLLEQSELELYSERLLALYEQSNEAANIGGWEIDLVKNVIYWSPVAKKIHGVDQAYVPNFTSALECFKEGESRDRMMNSILAAVECGESYDLELVLVTASQNEKWVRVQGNAEFTNGSCTRLYGTFQDIQNRKIQELQLANSELKYRSIIKYSLYAFLQIMPGEIIVEANQAATDMYGYSLEEFNVLGKKLLMDINDPELKQFKGLIEKNGNASAELIGIRKNGELFPCHVSSTVYTDAEGVRINSLMIIDITERIKAEEKIRISEEQFRGAFEYSAIGMGLFDLDAVCKRANQSLCDMLGYTHDELIGINFSTLTHPDDVDLNVVPITELIEGIKDSYNQEKRYIHKNGDVVWVHLGVSILRDDNKNPIHFIAQVQDITKFKDAEQAMAISEEKYRKIFENTQDIYYRTDQAGNIVDISPSIEKVYGEKAENIIGSPAVNFYYFDEDKQRLLNALKQVGSVMDFEVKLRNNKSELLYASVNARLIVDNGRVQGSEGFIRDITLRKLQENELTSLNTELKALNTHREKLLSVVGHDLRNPVSASLRLTELALMDISDSSTEELATYLYKIESGLQNANALLEELLSWAKTQFDSMDFNPVWIDDVQLQILVSLKRLKPMADAKNIELIETVGAGLRVFADKDMLDTILRNLVSNAIKFSANGNVVVAATLEFDMILFSVTDSGKGIPEKALGHLFNKKSHYTTFGTSGEKGTGLGLELCRDFVEKHGGKIWVESKLDVGSRFYFTIPLINSDKK